MVDMTVQHEGVYAGCIADTIIGISIAGGLEYLAIRLVTLIYSLLGKNDTPLFAFIKKFRLS